MARARAGRGPFETVEEESEILNALHLHGLNHLAARLTHLSAMIADDPDEPGLVIESLRSFAAFFMQEESLPVPEIGADPQGFLEAEWRIPASGGSIPASDEPHWGCGDGILAMKFLSTGLVQFFATSGPAGQGKEPLRIGGILPKKDIMSAVQPFVPRLTVP